MKDQYVGDVNDFFKYSILETIGKVLGEKILIVWMLTKSEGMDIEYSQYKENNELLYSKLQRIISSNKRKVKSIEEIYTNYIYHSDLLEKRTRIKYFNDVEEKSKTPGIIFFDPDKGVSYNNADKDIEHLYWDEIKRFWKPDKDLLIYQHFKRQKWHEYIAELNQYINRDLERAFLVPIKTKNAMFLYIAHKDIKEKLKESFIDWKNLIEII
jgi:hypothetical protein